MRRINPRIPKIIFEIGTPNIFHSRIRLILVNNERLYFEIITKDYQTIAVSLDISNWKSDSFYIISANIDTTLNIISIYENSILKSEIKYKYLNLPHIISGEAIIGCSLELDYLCPVAITYYSMAKSFTKSQIKSNYEIVAKLINAKIKS